MNKTERKARPVFEGFLAYFPKACRYASHVSHVANEQHNPGEKMHWAVDKSTDHADCLVRHMLDHLENPVDDDGLLHLGKVFWRAGALLETYLKEAEQHPLQDVIENDLLQHGFYNGEAHANFACKGIQMGQEFLIPFDYREDTDLLVQTEIKGQTCTLDYVIDYYVSGQSLYVQTEIPLADGLKITRNDKKLIHELLDREIAAKKAKIGAVELLHQESYADALRKIEEGPESENESKRPEEAGNASEGSGGGPHEPHIEDGYYYLKTGDPILKGDEYQDPRGWFATASFGEIFEPVSGRLGFHYPHRRKLSKTDLDIIKAKTLDQGAKDHGA